MMRSPQPLHTATHLGANSGVPDCSSSGAVRTSALSRRARPLRALAAKNAGFTLIEVLIATALLGFSLVVMFGFHTQARRSNMHARKITDCTYLAQTYMERMMALPWTSATGRPALLIDGSSDPTVGTDNALMWSDLEQPGTTLAVNGLNSTDTALGSTEYQISWDVEDMDTDDTWVRLRVRCKYQDDAFGTWHGTTISSYRFRDS